MSLSKSAKQVLGFTLIELLIVVAIIAILAAIAVPNFLEAQTRAKVARAVSDQRSLATALETYAVDNKGYPLSDIGQGNVANSDYAPSAGKPGQVDHLAFWMNYLTTPTSYITALPYDPFSKNTIVAPKTIPLKDHFKLYTGDNLGDGTTGPAGRYAVRRCWALVSVGPSQALNMNTGNPQTPDYSPKFVKNVGLYNFLMTKDDGYKTSTPPYPTCALQYDPTNGTSSDGHVVKTGGESVQYFTWADYNGFPTNP